MNKFFVIIGQCLFVSSFNLFAGSCLSFNKTPLQKAVAIVKKHQDLVDKLRESKVGFCLVKSRQCVYDPNRLKKKMYVHGVVLEKKDCFICSDEKNLSTILTQPCCQKELCDECERKVFVCPFCRSKEKAVRTSTIMLQLFSAFGLGRIPKDSTINSYCDLLQRMNKTFAAGYDRNILPQVPEVGVVEELGKGLKKPLTLEQTRVMKMLLLNPKEAGDVMLFFRGNLFLLLGYLDNPGGTFDPNDDFIKSLEKMSNQTIKFEQEIKKVESELVYRERSRPATSLDLILDGRYQLGIPNVKYKCTYRVQEPRGKLPWPELTFVPEKQLK